MSYRNVQKLTKYISFPQKTKVTNPFFVRNGGLPVFFSSTAKNSLSQPRPSILDKSQEVLVKKRVVLVYLPSFLRRYIRKKKPDVEIIQDSFPFNYTLSKFFGLGSLICFAIGYFEEDMLRLRIYTFTGVVLSLVFHYYREQPMWIPIGWNTLFLLTNAAMIGYLLKEKNDCSHMSDEETELFRNVFHKRGMNDIDFLHLMNLARRMEFKKGDKLIDQNRKNSRVYLVVKGKLSVWKNGQLLGDVGNHQFVGEMSFLGWCNAIHMVKTLVTETKHLVNNATAVVTAANDDSPPTQVEEKEKSLKKFMNIIKHQYHLGPTFSNGNNINNNSNNNNHSQKEIESRKNEETENLPDTESFAVNADVICEEDCTVFVWKFRELFDLMESEPEIGFIFERLVSSDLNKKISKQWEDDIKLRYRQLLAGGLMDGELNEIERKVLQEFREKYKITLIEHEKLLKEFGWTVEEYALGYKM
jgi:CRP-like cAMP-binding protein/uncharacterized membrane protein (Fun14 family)